MVVVCVHVCVCLCVCVCYHASGYVPDFYIQSEVLAENVSLGRYGVICPPQ